MQKKIFADFFHWELSNGHVIVDICDTYAEHDEGLGLGNFPLASALLPHPFCTCLWYVDTNKTLDQVAKELGRWEQGERNEAVNLAFREAYTEPSRHLSIPNNAKRIGTLNERVRSAASEDGDIYLLPEREQHIRKQRGADAEAILNALPKTLIPRIMRSKKRTHPIFCI